MKILWQSRSSKVMQAFYEGMKRIKIDSQNSYDARAALALAKHFKIEIDPQTILKKESLFSYWRRLFAYRPKADLLIVGQFPLVFGQKKRSLKSIAIIHQIDYASMRKNGLHRLYIKRLLSKAKKCDAVVTVSEHWKRFFQISGCKNIKLIYNSFELEKYSLLSEDETQFRNRNGIPLDKKIIYLGNNLHDKGVVEAIEIMMNTNYHLVVTDCKHIPKQFKIQNLHLSQTEYLSLLKISSLVFSFANLADKWNYIAHEALLSRTPLVGIYDNGKNELLDNAGQLIVSDMDELKLTVEKVVNEREKYSTLGHNYISQFDEKYFENSWVDLVNEIMTEK